MNKMHDKTKILIVDDDNSIQDTIRKILEPEYICHQVYDGHSAILSFSIFLPDVILLDWNLPIIDGFETLLWIKSNPETKHIPVIMITGYITNQQDLLKAYENGVVDFIKKPFDHLELLARVNSISQLAMFYKNEIYKKDKELTSLALQLSENIAYINEVFDIIISMDNMVKNEVFQREITEIKEKVLQKISKFNASQFEKQFMSINPDFYRNLAKTHLNLTPAELKLCSLLKLNLSSKEISLITHTTIESVRVARTRLRKKLNLDSDDNLTGYLARF